MYDGFQRRDKQSEERKIVLNQSMKKTGNAKFLFRILQGALIGLGAVLPGISGGVLAVIFGAVLVVGWFVMFMQYGALVAGHFSENAYTAVNLNILVLWALPLPLLVRLIVLSVSSRIENIRHRRVVQAVVAVLIAAFVTVTIACNMVQMVRYEEPETNMTQTEE